MNWVPNPSKNSPLPVSTVRKIWLPLSNFSRTLRSDVLLHPGKSAKNCCAAAVTFVKFLHHIFCCSQNAFFDLPCKTTLATPPTSIKTFPQLTHRVLSKKNNRLSNERVMFLGRPHPHDKALACRAARGSLGPPLRRRGTLWGPATMLSIRHSYGPWTNHQQAPTEATSGDRGSATSSKQRMSPVEVMLCHAVPCAVPCAVHERTSASETTSTMEQPSKPSAQRGEACRAHRSGKEGSDGSALQGALTLAPSTSQANTNEVLPGRNAFPGRTVVPDQHK